MKRKPKFTAELERELIIKAKAGDRVAMTALFEQFDRMLWKFAVSRCPFNAEVDDFVQLARLYFIDAVHRIDLTRGARLTTMLYASVKMQLLKHRKDCHVIHVPPSIANHNQEDAQRVLQGVKQLSCKGTTEKNDTFELSETIEDMRPEGIPLERREEIEKLNAAIQKLPERSRAVIESRMAGLTLREIGDAMQIGRERVRQLEEAAHEQIAVIFNGGEIKPKRVSIRTAQRRTAKQREKQNGKMADTGTRNYDPRRIAKAG